MDEELNRGTVKNKPSDLGATTNNFIGRPCYNGDAYLKKALLNDFRLYNRALSAPEVITLASHTASLDSAMILEQLIGIKNKLEVKELEAIYSNIILPQKSSDDVIITWKSTNKKNISDQGIVKRPKKRAKKAVVRLICTLSKKGISITKEFLQT